MPKKSKFLKIIIIVIVLAMIAGGVWYYYSEKNKVYTKYTVSYKTEIDENISYSYVKFADGILRYTTDGISYIKNGKEVWNKAITVKNPVADVCGEYFAIGGISTNSIKVMDVSGKDYDIATKYPIISIDVSAKGVVAVISDDGTASYVEVIGTDGANIATGRTVLGSEGAPIDISLSNDSTKLMGAYTAISSGSLQSKVVFYNYSSVGQNEVDRIVGGFNQYKSTIVPRVEFINNTTGVAFGDNMFTIYSMKQKPKITYELEFDRDIKKIFYSEKYVGIVFKSEDSQSAYTIEVYSTDGKKVISEDTDYMFEDVMFSEDNIFMYNKNSCRLLSLSGKERFNKSFDFNIKSIFSISQDCYVIIKDNTIEQIKLN